MNKYEIIVFCVILSLIFSLLFLMNHVFAAMLLFGLLILLFLNTNIERIVLILAISIPFNNMIIVNMGFMDLRMLQVLFIAVILFISLSRCISNKQKMPTITFERYDLFFFLFIFLALTQVFFIKYKFIAFRESVQMVYFYLIFVLLRSIFRDESNFDFFLKGFNIATFIFVLFAIAKLIIGFFPLKLVYVNFWHGSINFLTSLPKMQETVKSGSLISRTDSFFWGSVGTANILIIQYLLLSIFKNKINNFTKYLLIIVLIFTGSRAGWITFYLVFLIDAFLTKRQFMTKLSISAGVITIILTFSPWVSERLAEIFLPYETSNKVHYALWSAAIDIFKNNCLFGIGTGTFEYILHDLLNKFGLNASISSHNIFLKILSENGVVGIFLLGSFFLAIFLKALNSYKYSHDQRTKLIILAFLSTFLMNLTMNAYMIEFFWMILALLASRITVYINKGQERRYKR